MLKLKGKNGFSIDAILKILSIRAYQKHLFELHTFVQISSIMARNNLFMINSQLRG